MITIQVPPPYSRGEVLKALPKRALLIQHAKEIGVDTLDLPIHLNIATWVALIERHYQLYGPTETLNITDVSLGDWVILSGLGPLIVSYKDDYYIKLSPIELKPTPTKDLKIPIGITPTSSRSRQITKLLVTPTVVTNYLGFHIGQQYLSLPDGKHCYTCMSIRITNLNPPLVWLRCRRSNDEGLTLLREIAPHSIYSDYHPNNNPSNKYLWLEE
jgi:hypothetical protein